jgi:hypothetical protein
MSAATHDKRDFAELRRQNLGIGRQCGFGEKYDFPGYVPDECKTKPHPKILTWGDSYARAWTTAILDPLKGMGIEQATMARCDPLTAMARLPKDATELSQYGRAYTESCINFLREVGEYIANSKDIEIVVLAARFQTVLSESNSILSYEKGRIVEHDVSRKLIAKGLANSVKLIRDSGKKVVILAPPPADGSDIGGCLERAGRFKVTFGPARSCDLRLADVKRVRKPVSQMLEMTAKEADVAVIDVYDFFCDKTICHTEIEGVPMYRDAGHLSVDGARLVGKRTKLGQDILDLAR